MTECETELYDECDIVTVYNSDWRAATCGRERITSVAQKLTEIEFVHLTEFGSRPSWPNSDGFASLILQEKLVANQNAPNPRLPQICTSWGRPAVQLRLSGRRARKMVKGTKQRGIAQTRSQRVLIRFTRFQR